MRILLLIASLAPLAGTPVGSSLQSSEGVIYVRVRIAGSSEGVPLAGVRLRLLPIERTPNIFEPTDEYGEAVFRNLAPGTYEVTAMLNGYFVPRSASGAPPPISSLGGLARLPQVMARATTVLDDRQNAQTVDLELVKAGSIGGHVYDDQGLPLPNAAVNVMLPMYLDGRRLLQMLVAPVTTDVNGAYRIPSLGPGDYIVRATIAPPEDDANTRIVYYPGVERSLRASVVRLSGSEDVSSIDFVLSPASGVTVSGSVRNYAPGPATRDFRQEHTFATFYLIDQDPNALDDPIVLTNSVESTSEDPSELRFEFRNVPPGTYNIFCILPGTNLYSAVNIDRYFSTRIPVTVGNRDIIGLVAAVYPNTPITVLVHADPPELPMDSVKANVLTKERLPALVQGMANAAGRSTMTRQVGPGIREIVIPGLPQATYRLELYDLPDGAYVADTRVDGRSIHHDATVEVGPGFSGTLNVLLRTGGGVIQGNVRALEPGMAAQAAVTLIPAFQLRGNPAFYKRVQADDSGAFTMTGIAPGEYRLFAWPVAPAGQAEEDPDFMGQYESRGQSVSVQPGLTTSVDVHLIADPR